MLKSMNHKKQKNRKVSNSEVATVILITAMYFGGNIEPTISFVRSASLMTRMLSKSRFNPQDAQNRRTVGIPVEYTFTTGNAQDMDGIKKMPLNLPEGSEIMVDSAIRIITWKNACR
jgi:hypothetical protein